MTRLVAPVWPMGVWALSVVAASLTYRDGDWLLPLDTDGEPCPFPLDPLLMPRNVPIGMYHCPYCGEMVLAGLPHGDWRNISETDLPSPDEQFDSSDWPF